MQDTTAQRALAQGSRDRPKRDIREEDMASRQPLRAAAAVVAAAAAAVIRRFTRASRSTTFTLLPQPPLWDELLLD